MMHQMQQPMQQQSMSGVPMMPPMMNQSMPGIGMNQFNTNIPMGNQPPNMNTINPMNPMKSINPMNSMSSLNPMSSMSSMGSLSSINSMSSMGSLNSVTPMNSMESMNSMNSMMPIGPNMNQFQQQMPMGNNQFQYQNTRRLSQNSIPTSSKPKKNFKQMFNNNSTNSSINPNPVNLQQQPKKKSNKLSQSKAVSILQPSIQPQPTTTAPIPPNSIAPSPMPLIPPKFPIQNAPIPPMVENQPFLKSLAPLTEEKTELFFRFFECKSKRKEESIENFKNLRDKITSFNPNFPALLHSFVASFANDSFTKLKDPPLPLIYRRAQLWKNPNGPFFDIPPTYKFINRLMNPNSQPIDVIPSSKEKKSKARVIASFVSFNEVSPPTTLVVGKDEVRSYQYGTNEVRSYQYGTNEYFYPVITDGIIPKRIQFQFKSQPFTFLTWLIVQYVELKSAVDVLHELMIKSGMKVNDQNLNPLSTGQSENPLGKNNLPSRNDLCVYAKTPQCKGCSFQVYQIIEEITNNGSAKCPTCGSNIILKDLILDLVEDSIPEVPGEEVEPDFMDNTNREILMIAPMLIGDQMCDLMKVRPKQLNWKEKFYGGNGVPVDNDAEPLQFSTAEEYNKIIDEIM